MQWREVEIECSPQAADTVATVFQDWPEVQGILFEGAVAEGPLHPEYGEWFDEGLRNMPADSVRIKFYVPEWMPEAELQQRVQSGFSELSRLGVNTGGLKPVFRWVDESSWAKTWEEEHQPINVGEKITIVPLSKQNGWNDASRVPIFLEPGRAFGTGSHPTTQMCLELLEPYIATQASFLDVGCGTGVLAIAAAKLGTARVVAVDIDPVAVRSAAENAEQNGVSGAVTVLQGDLVASLRPALFHAVAANILRNAVLQLAEVVPAFLEPAGVFVSSGFLGKDIPAVSDALEAAGFQVRDTRVRGDWAAVAAVKPV